MTALEKYRKLEGPGLWAASEQDQRREVVVGFGDATLVISDSRSMIVLSHWSLPAVERVNPGKRPAIYRPEGGGGEVLELDDDWLIDALKVVQGALRPPRSILSRLRRPILAGLGALGVIATALILPPALQQHTAAVVPMAKRVELGEELRLDLMQSGARTCNSIYGAPALASLQRRLFQTPAQLVVMRGLPQDTPRIQHVMGRIFIIDARLLEEATSAEALGGALLIAAQRAAQEDPLRPLLRHAGLIATFRLLTSAELPASAMAGYGRALLRAPLALPDMEPLLERFARAEVSTRPLVDNPFALDPTLAQIGQTLRNADPLQGEPPATPLLTDGQWVSLLNICDG
ncbi:MAG: hypothetical protein LAT78_15020 [Roseinatronobacter sp.]|jgi:hypothetical protein|nr:hypothetical protein [Roseinatronobacter sp.]